MLIHTQSGQPPDNADQFIAWLESQAAPGTDLEGVQYAVFGCGHRDWKDTFQRIPTLVDESLANLGGKSCSLADLKIYRNKLGVSFWPFNNADFNISQVNDS